MATYLTLINWTDKGIGGVKDSPKRYDDAKALGSKFGVEFKQLYMLMGDYDLATIVEAPDDAAMAKFLLSVGSGGSVRTTTFKAFTEQEYRSIVAALP